MAIIINALTVGLGFSVLLLAGGQHIRRFGGLTALTMFSSALFTYFPFDNAEIKFGFSILEGKETTTFGSVKDNDEVYLRVKYSF